MDIGLITTLLGVILAGMFSQTVAVWVKFSHLEKKITESKCPFGGCPIFERAKDEAVADRKIRE
mgnify:CR=1 FL=1